MTDCCQIIRPMIEIIKTIGCSEGMKQMPMSIDAAPDDTVQIPLHQKSGGLFTSREKVML